MRRIVWLCAALSVTVAATAHAQALTMQMSNGWTFSFSGNVHAFYVFESEGSTGTPGIPFGLVGVDRQGSAIRTGLLPTFAVFEAFGREGETDLKVHFGFAPQIQTPGGHDNFGNGTQAGAQIDMRQVFLTVGGKWGQILAGRELGVYQRQNILNDQTLFGTGATGGNFGNPGGTTLGRIGFGYVYPNFNAQIAYSTPGDKPAVLTLALFDPSTNNGFDEVILPRFETELVYSYQQAKAWVGAMAQHQKDTDLTANESKVAWGVSGGARYSGPNVSLTGSGYYGQGIGTTLKFLGGRTSVASSTELRKSYGFIGQLTVTPRNSKATVGLSFGNSSIKAADDEPDFTTHNRSGTGGIYYQATQSLKVVFEGTYAWTEATGAPEKNKTFVGSAGLMLFF